MSALALADQEPYREKRERYRLPVPSAVLPLSEALSRSNRPGLEPEQLNLLSADRLARDIDLFYAGELSILDGPAVAVVGARRVTPNGAARTRRLSKELAKAGIVVVSGLAKGVDTNAHAAAIQAGGRTVAVIGTPLGKAYPAENARLQEEIARHHLLISPFAEASRVFPSNFPVRNRVMAAVTDGTVIIEASDTSGSLHQAAECERLGRWLFILRSVVEDPHLKWPKSFAKYERACVVDTAADVIDRILR